MSAVKINHEQNTISFNQGDIIVEEGDAGGDLYIIRSGVAEVFRIRDGKELILAKLGAGEMLGVMTVTSGGPRSASVRAKTAITATRVDHAKVKELMSSLPKWATAMMEDLITRVKQTNELYEKSHSAHNESLHQVGRIVTIAAQVAEGFLPLAETLSHKVDDRTVSVDDVLEKLSSIINEPYRDLRRIVDVFDEKELVPWKSKARNSRCTVGELNNFAFFAKFTKDHRKSGKLSEFIGTVSIKDRKHLAALADIGIKASASGDSFKIDFNAAQIELKKVSCDLDIQTLKQAKHFKFIDLSESDPATIQFNPHQLRLTVQCLDTINALDQLEDGGPRIQRQRSLVY
jgi:CRP-like cAMP-binding protein